MQRLGTVAGGLTLALVLAATPAGCNGDTADFTVAAGDAGDGGASDSPPASEADASFDPTLGGPCTEDAQCDDLVPCTFDSCDRVLSRCRNVPDDSRCQDDVYCNGQERCVLRQGCAPGPVVTCSDENPCTIDRCIEEERSCARVPRDSDGDGDPDDHCQPERDCDDTDPTVSSTHAEVCGNFKDDDCDGEIDEEPCVVPQNDVCATAQLVEESRTLLLSTVATTKDYPTTCSVPNPAAGRDIVVAIKVPEGGGAKDIVTYAKTSGPPTSVAIALEATCGSSASEIHCGVSQGAYEARAIARSVAAGATIYAVITTQLESAVDLRIDYRAPTTKPTNEDCSAPALVPLEAPFEVSLIDAKKDLESACSERDNTGERTFAFDLATPRDVRIYASTLVGSGSPVVSLRSSTCTAETRCRGSSNPPLFARSLPAGRHVFSVAGTTQIDANVVVRTFAPTTAPPTQSCATAPAAPIGEDFVVDLGQSEDAIANGCFPGAPSAAYKLDLAETTDILAIARFPQGDNGAISLNGEACGTADRLSCQAGGSTVRLSQRGLGAGSYRLVVAGSSGQPAEVVVFTRPAAFPTTVTVDGCVGTQAIVPPGGFYVGDTSKATANLGAGCDADGLPLGGAKEQLLRLDLPARRRVVLNGTGLSYQMLIDLRKGNACPGFEVPNACYVSSPLVDLFLDPGTYWVQIDGYNLAEGTWNLTAFVVDP